MLRELTRRAADPPTPPLPMNNALRSLPANNVQLAEAGSPPLGAADGAVVLGLVARELSRLRGGAGSAIGGGGGGGESGHGAVAAAAGHAWRSSSSCAVRCLAVESGNRPEAARERAEERLEAATSSMTSCEASRFG